AWNGVRRDHGRRSARHGSEPRGHSLAFVPENSARAANKKMCALECQSGERTRPRVLFSAPRRKAPTKTRSLGFFSLPSPNESFGGGAETSTRGARAPQT